MRRGRRGSEFRWGWGFSRDGIFRFWGIWQESGSGVSSGVKAVLPCCQWRRLNLKGQERAGVRAGEGMLMCFTEGLKPREGVRERLFVLRGVEVMLESLQLLNVVMRASKGYESRSQQLYPRCVWTFTYVCTSALALAAISWSPCLDSAVIVTSSKMERSWTLILRWTHI